MLQNEITHNANDEYIRTATDQKLNCVNMKMSDITVVASDKQKYLQIVS